MSNTDIEIRSWTRWGRRFAVALAAALAGWWGLQAVPWPLLVAEFHDWVVLPVLLKVVYANGNVLWLCTTFCAVALLLRPHGRVYPALAVLAGATFLGWAVLYEMWRNALASSAVLAAVLAYVLARYHWVGVMRVPLAARLVFRCLRRCVEADHRCATLFDAIRAASGPFLSRGPGAGIWERRNEPVKTAGLGFWGEAYGLLARLHRRRVWPVLALARLICGRRVPGSVRWFWLSRILEALYEGARYNVSRQEQRQDNWIRVWHHLIEVSEARAEQGAFNTAALGKGSPILPRVAETYDLLSRIGLARQYWLLIAGQANDDPDVTAAWRRLREKRQQLIGKSVQLRREYLGLPPLTEGEVPAGETASVSLAGERPEEVAQALTLRMSYCQLAMNSPGGQNGAREVMQRLTDDLRRFYQQHRDYWRPVALKAIELGLDAGDLQWTHPILVERPAQAGADADASGARLEGHFWWRIARELPAGAAARNAWRKVAEAFANGGCQDEFECLRQEIAEKVNKGDHRGVWDALADDLDSLPVTQPPEPCVVRFEPLPLGHKELPSFFVRFWLAAAITLTASIGTVLVYQGLHPARPAPDYRRSVNHRQFVPTTLAAGTKELRGTVLVGSLGGGVQPFEPASLYWRRPFTAKTTRDRLLSDNVTGLDIGEESIAYVGRGGKPEDPNWLNLSNLSASTFWSTPFLDASQCDPSSRDSFTCVAPSPTEDLILIGSREAGIGRYQLATRRWLPGFNRAGGHLSDDHVSDLVHWAPRLTLVAHRAGIDVCAMDEERCELRGTLAGLASNGVRRLYPDPAETWPGSLDVWFVSVGQGLGRVTVRRDGSEAKRATLVSERSVPELTLEACRDAVCDQTSDHLWVAFKQSKGVGIARYRFSDHDWLGMAGALPADDVYCLGWQEGGSGLAGTDNGVWQAFDRGGAHLKAVDRGPAHESIAEIASSRKLTWAHSRSWSKPPATRVRMLERQAGGEGDGVWPWRDFIGPGRFPDLQDADLLCVAQVDDANYYVGTRGKGIGVWKARTRELGARFHSKSEDPRLRLPEDTILDIAATTANNIAAVSGSHKLLVYDGIAWKTALGSSSLAGRASNITSASGTSGRIAVAVDPAIGVYEMNTHTWQPLPEVPGISRLHYAGAQLLGLTKEGSLVAFGQQLTGRAAWGEVARNVSAFVGNNDLVAAIAGQDAEAKRLLFVRQHAGSVSRTTAPVPHARAVRNWTGACAEGASLYLASDNRALARYDLDSHRWDSLTWPENAAAAAKLEATGAGLWLLADDGSLHLWQPSSRAWTEKPVRVGVKAIVSEGKSLLVLHREGDAAQAERCAVERLGPPGRTDTIIGRGIPGDPNVSVAAADFGRRLFLGSTQAIARYTRESHDWRSWKIPFAGEQLHSFAQTNGFLYAHLADTSGSGHVMRFLPGSDDLETLKESPDAADLLARRLSADGPVAAIQRPRSDVLVVADAAPQRLLAVYASSGAPLGTDAILCAAETGDGLYLGTGAGQVLGYDVSQDGLSRWTTVAAAGPAGSDSPSPPGAAAAAVRKIVPLQGGKAQAIVRDGSIEVLARAAPGDPWRTVRSLATGARGCDAWEAGGGKLFFATTLNDADKQAGCFSRVALGPALEGAAAALVAEGLNTARDEARTAAAAEIKTASDVLLFRAGANGTVGRYSFAAHRWQTEGIAGVREFGAGLGTLWAYSPDAMALYRLVVAKGTPTWEPYGGGAKIADIAANASTLVLRHQDGRIEVLDVAEGGAIRTRCLAESVPNEMKTCFGDLVACAEISGTLLCSFSTGATCQYRLQNHAWRKLPVGVRQFLKVGGDDGQLLAVLANDTVARWSSANGGQFLGLPGSSPGPADRLMAAGTGVFLATKDGGLHVLSAGDKWTPLMGSGQRMKGDAWPLVSAATEHGGCLLLGLADANGGRLAVYDPITLGWQECDTPGRGTPEHFLPCGQRLFVVCRGGAAKTLCLYDPRDRKLSPLVAGLRSTAAAAGEVWCLGTEGALTRLNAATLQTTSPGGQNVAVALPPNATVRTLRASSQDLVAVLSDNSVWHHGAETFGWRKLAPAAPGAAGGFQRQIVEVGGRLLASTPTGELLVYEPSQDQYVKAVEAIPVPRAGPTPACWQVQAAGNEYHVRVEGDNAWMPLVKGRLPIDDVRDLGVDSQYLYIQTAAGTTRVIDRKTMVEVRTGVSPEAVAAALRKPSAVLFNGTVFACTAFPSGVWKTAAKEAPACSLFSLASGAAGAREELLPHAANGQIGFTRQWVHTPVAKDGALFAAIPGGAIRLNITAGQATVARVYRLGGGAVPAIAKSGAALYCRLESGQFLSWGAARDAWVAPSDEAAAKAAFTRAADLLDRSALGPVWAVEPKDGVAALSVEARDGKRFGATLDKNGFGMDRVAAMALGPRGVQLYTPDGLLTYDGAEPGGGPQSVQKALAVAEEMLAAPCRVVKGASNGTPALLSRDGKKAWEFRTGWEPVDAAALAAAIARDKPLLLDGQFCKWGRDDKVVLTYPASTTAVRTSFDPRTGRLGIDQVTAIAAADGVCWAGTRSGLCRLGDAGFDVHLNEEAAYDWPKGVKFKRLAADGRDYLYAILVSARTGKPVVLRFGGKTWTEVTDPAELQAVTSADEWLLRGRRWQLLQAQANGLGPRTFRRHWEWQKAGEFMDVSLDSNHPQYPGAFDFERINDLLVLRGCLWLATDLGVVQVDVETRQVVGIAWPGGAHEVSRLVRRKGMVYAESQGALFAWDEDGQTWVKAGPGTLELASPLVDGTDWQVERRGSRLVVRCRLARTDKELTEVSLRPSGTNVYRFGFDTATAVAANDSALALLTEAGLVQRIGPSNEDVRLLAPLPAGGPGAAELTVYGKKEQQRLLYREGAALVRYEERDDAWRTVEGEEKAEIERLLVSVLTCNNTWRVRRGGSAEAQVAVRFPKDSDYKPAPYARDKGLFGFDVFCDVAVCRLNEAELSVFIATEGGVVRTDAGGAWERLYADPEADGMPPDGVCQLAGRSPENLMAAGVSGTSGRERRLFAFQAAEDRWKPVPARPESEQAFAQLRATLAADAKGWRILDLREYGRLLGRPAPPGTPPLSLAWKEQPVWLCESEERIRFGHDIVYAAAFQANALWLGTAGGAVRYRIADENLGTAVFGSPEIHARDLVASYDPWSPHALPSAGIIRTSVGTRDVVCFLSADGRTSEGGQDAATNFKEGYVLRRGEDAFAAVREGEDTYTAACTSLVSLGDRFWSWRKTGPWSMEVEFSPDRADVPAGYTRLGAGTFRFFDCAYPSDHRRTERTIVSCFGRVFFVTAGGIMSYDADDGQPAKLYAVAAPGTSAAVSLEGVRELWYDADRDTLFARRDARVFAFSPAPGGSPDHWTIHQGTDDPFDNATLVVSNDLLKWRQLSDGPSIRLAHSDLAPDTPYEFFYEGKFSFDYVHTVAFKEEAGTGKAWLATAGGVVRVDRGTLRIEQVFAQSFPFSPNGGLPNVRELVFDRSGDRNLYARTEDTACFRFDGARWARTSAAQAEPAFRREYTRLNTPFWRWVQPPHGLYVQLHQSDPPDLSFGSACPEARAPLVSRGRMVWDDLRDALLCDKELLFTTPAGVCCYDYDFRGQAATYRRLHGEAGDPVKAVKFPMAEVERLLREENREVLTWNRSTVFRGRRGADGWQWEVDPRLTPEMMVSHKQFKNADGTWTLEQVDGGRDVKVSLGSSSRTLDVGQAVPDLSRAVLSPEGIWCPTDRDVLWIDTSLFVRQGRSLPWVMLGAGLAAAGLGLVVLRRRLARQAS